MLIIILQYNVRDCNVMYGNIVILNYCKSTTNKSIVKY